MTDLLNTNVSAPGMPIPSGVTAAGAAPGATGPLATMSLPKAAIGAMGIAAGGYVVLVVLFRRGRELPPLRIDATAALAAFFGVEVFRITVNTVAYHWHGHSWSQAWLLLG